MSTKTRKFLEKLSGGSLSFGDLLSSIRLGEEMTQSDFAAKLKISKSHLCDIEKGRKNVSSVRAAEFAKKLKYSSEQFVKLAIQDELTKAGLKLKVDIKAS